MSDLYKDLDLTIFPEGTDSFTQWLDITASDGPLIKRYTDAMNEGNVALANQILAEIPSSTQKIIKANDLNKLTQCILAVERFYKTDVEDYIDTKQTQWTSIINQFNYKGVWSNGTSYEKNNMVSYTRFGSELIYIAIKDVPVGTPTSNNNYWRQLTIQGNDGPSGEGLSYRQEWNVSVSYALNDAVTYGGGLWMATAPSKGIEPSQGNASWKLIMSLKTTTYPIQDTQPQTQSAGELWFNTQGNPTQYYFLATLQSPAQASDIALGKQAYDEFGNLIVGTKA